MMHCCYASALVVVYYSGNILAITCGTTSYLGASNYVPGVVPWVKNWSILASNLWLCFFCVLLTSLESWTLYVVCKPNDHQVEGQLLSIPFILPIWNPFNEPLIYLLPWVHVRTYVNFVVCAYVIIQTGGAPCFSNTSPLVLLLTLLNPTLSPVQYLTGARFCQKAQTPVLNTAWLSTPDCMWQFVWNGGLSNDCGSLWCHGPKAKEPLRGRVDRGFWMEIQTG